MAGIAPLGGSPTTNQPDGTAATVPGTIAPNTTPPPQKTPDTGPSFTAFPSSYEGFGSDGNGFGTLSVVNGQLSIVQTPPAPPASTPAAVAQTDDIKAAVPSAPSGSQTPGAAGRRNHRRGRGNAATAAAPARTTAISAAPGSAASHGRRTDADARAGRDLHGDPAATECEPATDPGAAPKRRESAGLAQRQRQ